MNARVKNILIFVGALILGSMVNGLIIQYGPVLIPPPEGLDFSTEKGLLEGMPRMEAKHFITPFFAHAIGTLVSAMLMKRFAFENAGRYTFGVAFLHLFGGIIMVYSYPAPFWFEAIDLIFAYLPMAWLANKWVPARVS
jgi:hypothetical protein